MFLDLERAGRIIHGQAHLNDQLERLMILYRVIKANPEELIKELKELDNRYKSQEHYLRIRHYYNTGVGISDLHVAAMFMYLNRLCVNNLHRVNRKGHFNVNYRKDPNRDIVREDALRNAHRAFQKAHLYTGSYRRVLDLARPGDFVYLDPPYWPLTKTANFTSYSGEFGPAQQVELAADCRELTRRGIQVMVNNAEHPEVRSLYSGWDIRTMYEGRGINSDPTKRGKVPALIIRNYI